ncbi:C40 family peptidase [Treponema pedis]|nr:C40 family peptidase [Treponema pedis]QSI05568.1 NlpC/P60 family protein [Treponema pedis]
MKKIIFYMLIVLFAGLNLFSEQPPESPRLSFINAAYKYLKTPYKYACADSGGMDCSGLIYRASLDSVKIALPRSASGIASFAERIEDSDIQPGDLLFFNTTGTAGEKISHAGLYIGGGEFIHSASQGPAIGVIISSLEEKYWKNCYRFAGRILPKEEIFN